jgi:ribonuclease-3 family protein
MKEEFPFTPRENTVLSRGRNSVSGSRNRRDQAAYQDATALEAIVGFLYITDSKRCEEMLNWIHKNLERASLD